MVAKIWYDGLYQTVDYCYWFMKPFIRRAFDGIAKQSLHPDVGDIGPNGANLIKTWMKRDDRSCMFVAAFRDEPTDVVGCLGVKRGNSEGFDDDDDSSMNSNIASMWRVSVAEKARRHGVGRALVVAAEKWAVKQQQSVGTTPVLLQAITMNPSAAEFYLAQGYVKNDERFIPVRNPFARFAFLYLFPPIHCYSKQL